MVKIQQYKGNDWRYAEKVQPPCYRSVIVNNDFWVGTLVALKTSRPDHTKLKVQIL